MDAGRGRAQSYGLRAVPGNPVPARLARPRDTAYTWVRLKLILSLFPISARSMLKQLRVLVGRKEAESPPRECALGACATGCRAAVLGMECESGEASRLRSLGLFEGSCVTVVDSRNGMLLDVRGSRLALGDGLASAIRVLPLGS